MFYVLIDDDSIFNFIHAKVIRQVDEEADIADFISSSEALAFIKERFVSHKAEPTLVFLDINMPEINGFELLDAIKELPAESVSKMSIYIITSSLNEKDVRKSKEYPILKGYIGKPLSFERLNEVIKFEKNR
jgi:response regulator of citrate/malate metabolism